MMEDTRIRKSLTTEDKRDRRVIYLEALRKKNEAHCIQPFQDMNRFALDNVAFQEWPASVSKHHAYGGGLVIHTMEVLGTILDNCVMQMNMLVLVTSAIWHDYGKIWDYDRNPQFVPGSSLLNDSQKMNGIHPWRYTQHRARIRHVARSYAEFMLSVSRFFTLEERAKHAEVIEHIGHCILAHHGRLEWGSPVEPQTREAWALHLADMTSVRVLDGAKST